MDPIHVGVCGLIPIRCVGMAANNETILRHKVSSVWTGVDRFIWRPFAVLSACCRQVNIPTATDMAVTVLYMVPISLCQHCRERWLVLGGMMSIRERRLFLQYSRRVMICLKVSITQPRTTFCILQAESPLRSFLR